MFVVVFSYKRGFKDVDDDDERKIRDDCGGSGQRGQVTRSDGALREDWVLMSASHERHHWFGMTAGLRMRGNSALSSSFSIGFYDVLLD